VVSPGAQGERQVMPTATRPPFCAAMQALAAVVGELPHAQPAAVQPKQFLRDGNGPGACWRGTPLQPQVTGIGES